MKYFCALLLLAVPALQGSQPPAVESISITGAQNYKLSQQTLQQIQRLVGAPLNQQALDALAQGIGNELGDCSVSPRVTPGDRPEQVKVVLEVAPRGDPAKPPAVAEAAAANVNSRYTVEDVEIKGADKRRLSKGLRQELHRLVNQKFDQEALDDLAPRIRRELNARSVTHKVLRGDQPDHVKVVFEVSLEDEADLHLSKFLYHSKQGWSGKAFGDFSIAPRTSLLLGLVSDGDDLLERYAGVAAGFETRRVVSDHVRLRFLFETYHNQWNGATLSALKADRRVPGIYRTRKNFEPALTFLLAPGLRLSVGTSLQLIQTQYPAARTEAANAAVGALRFRKGFEDPEGNRHEIEAGYDLRAATRTFDSDFLYTRHQWSAGYKIAGRRQAVVDKFTAGTLTGRAPLYERYILGDGMTLRGWHKFDVAPLGGDRMVHNSLEYRHAVADDAPIGEGPTSVVVFYDAGSAWNRGRPAEVKHAVGAGLRWQHFFSALAFPVKAGRMAPMFLVGAYFTEGATF